MKTANTENPRKNNYFLSVVSFDENGKKKYDIVYTSKTYDECYNYSRDNFCGSVPTAIRRYNEFIKEGVEANTLINFKNPRIY